MALEGPLHIVVTGGAGFLGGEIVKAINTKHPGWTITVVDLRRPRPEIEAHMQHFIQADITSSEQTHSAIVSAKPDLVVHTAGLVPARSLRYSTNPKDWERTKTINYDGTRNVLEATLAAGCRRFVYTSSCTVTVDDLDNDHFNMDETEPLGRAYLHYGRSKAMAETFVLSPAHADRGLIACALRPATIIGPGDVAVISLLHDVIAKRETNFIVGDGYNLYDFMYVDNAAHAHVLAVENLLTSETAAGHAFFVSNQEPVYFWDFLAFIWAQFEHVPAFRVRIPMSVAWLAGFVLEWMTWFAGAAPTLDRGSVKDGVRTHYANNEKAIRILGYRPIVGLTEGVRRSCDWYKEYLAAEAAKAAESKKIR